MKFSRFLLIPFLLGTLLLGCTSKKNEGAAPTETPPSGESSVSAKASGVLAQGNSQARSQALQFTSYVSDEETEQPASKVAEARTHWEKHWQYFFEQSHEKLWNELVMARALDPQNPVYRSLQAAWLSDGNYVTQDQARAEELAEGCLQALLKIEPRTGEVCDAIGNLYSRGLGVHEDRAEAWRWWKEGAERGFAGNILDLGLAQIQGDNEWIEHDPDQGFQWLKKIAEEEKPLAMFLVAECLASGTGTDHDPQQAMKWLQRAAESNCLIAMRRYAEVLIDKDFDQGVEWLKKAAARNDYESCLLLSAMFTVDEFVDQDLEQARFYFEKGIAVETGTEERSMTVSYAIMLLKGDVFEYDEAKAKQLLETAATRGSGAAYSHLHRLYARGYRSIPREPVKAFELAKKFAEEHQNPVAIYHMAGAYQNGFGVKKDVIQAIELYEFLAETEDQENAAIALFEIAEIYHYGTEDGEIRSSDYIAKAWYRKAAEKGHGESANTLARILEEEGSEEEAEKWYAKGEELGWRRGMARMRASRSSTDSFRRMLEILSKDAEETEEEPSKHETRLDLEGKSS